MYGMSNNYKVNEVISKDTGQRNYWQKLTKRDLWQIPVYKYISVEMDKDSSPKVIMEIGCGTGQKGVKHFEKYLNNYVGVDQPSGILIASTNFPKINWVISDLENTENLLEVIKFEKPNNILCVDVIEHLADPESFLKVLLSVKKGTKINISTPARESVEDQSIDGPPRNPLHVREWTSTELLDYLSNLGFTVINQLKFLPRGYNFLSPKELLRLVFRLISGKKLPDEKSCQLVILEV